jgi:hypothetical protein
MQFDFYGGAGVSGYLAFTSSAITTATGGSSSARPLLLVADHSHDALHIVDVVGQTHAGYLAPPRVHRRAPGRGCEWGLTPGGRQRLEEHLE